MTENERQDLNQVPEAQAEVVEVPAEQAPVEPVTAQAEAPAEQIPVQTEAPEMPQYTAYPAVPVEPAPVKNTVWMPIVSLVLSIAGIFVCGTPFSVAGIVLSCIAIVKSPGKGKIFPIITLVVAVGILVLSIISVVILTKNNMGSYTNLLNQ